MGPDCPQPDLLTLKCRLIVPLTSSFTSFARFHGYFWPRPGLFFSHAFSRTHRFIETPSLAVFSVFDLRPIARSLFFEVLCMNGATFLMSSLSVPPSSFSESPWRRIDILFLEVAFFFFGPRLDMQRRSVPSFVYFSSLYAFPFRTGMDLLSPGLFSFLVSFPFEW